MKIATITKKRVFFDSFKILGKYINNKTPSISIAPRFDEYKINIIPVIRIAKDSIFLFVNKGSIQNDVKNK
jgi:hypothetical protein